MEPIDILKKYYHFAVIGVSQNTDKYGYKIFKRLRDRSYDVYGVSPIYDQVDNIPLYSSLEDINGPIDVVVFVVNKKYAYDYIDEMKEAMHADRRYYTVVSIGGEHRFLCCTPISENVDWYLVAVMPSGVLNDRLSNLDSVRIMIMISSAMIILFTMLIIFIMYYRLAADERTG